jgi:hypothetical protein
LSFKIGDRVIISGARPRLGFIVEDFGLQGPGEFSVVFDGGTRRYVEASNLTLETPRFVHVVTQRTVWVTLPGDTAGHKLTNDDALALLRQLEEALS